MEEPKLYASNDLAQWKSTFAAYTNVLEAKCSKKTKAKDSKDLKSLDKWYQVEFPLVLQERKPMHINLDELVKIMKWKLTKGKFRPGLESKAASNKDADVIDASTKAFKLLPNIRNAIEALTTLYGIGPATASAILAVGAPDQAAFMADEACAEVLEAKPLKYDIKTYLGYANSVREKANILSDLDNGNWTPHKVELTLWTYNMAHRVLKQPELLEPNENKSTGEKKGAKRSHEIETKNHKKHKA